MNIVWITSESHPYAKTGGLADVSLSLPAALATRGHKVSVIMPYYPRQMAKLKLKFHSRTEMLGVPFGGQTEWAQILEHRLDKNLSYYFIEFNRFFDRDGLYDWDGVAYPDNGERYIFLSRAAMQTILKLKLKPDIIHTNDWHTALNNVYLKSGLYRNAPNFANCRSVLTIHNLGYQGVIDKSNLFWTGLGWEYYNFLCLEFFDQINLLKGGIMTADMINAVSPTNAEEILSSGYGFNLESSLQHRAAQGKLRGILNGINIKEWDPAHDNRLPATFSAEDLSGKAVCKAELQKQFSLPVRPDVPLFGAVTRLAHQKGIDVICESLEDLLIHDDIQVAILGSGENGMRDWLNSLAARFPNKLGVYIGYDDSLAHQVEAGSDIFLMPSRYEPCGLNQMYSMRYGTLPLVRATGGLADTVINYDPASLDISTGFVFYDLYAGALSGTMRWAAATCRKHPDHIRAMQLNGMSKDFSWDHTAAEYERLYEDAHR